jgi:filamentous hemagglutinin family protein
MKASRISALKPIAGAPADWLICTCCILFAAGAAHAQIVTDGSLGAATSLNGANVVIAPTLGRQSGANLFHSFSTFNVAALQTVRFDSVATTNIIARVTGGTASQINGVLAANANLFLLNPQGIMFGSNASLNIAGSFNASTADYLRFGDNTVFYANPSVGSVFSTAPPTAFGFLDSNVAPISATNATLSGAAGQSISLVGGNITLNNSNVLAPNGRINIAAVGSPGEVVVGPAALTANGFGAMGNIQFDQSSINRRVSGGTATFGETADIYIRGGSFVMGNDSAIAGITTLQVTPHVLDIDVNSLQIRNSFIDLEAANNGSSTNAVLRARQFEVGERAVIFVGGGGVNPSGDMTIVADDFRILGINAYGLSLVGTGAVSNSATGRAGNLYIQAHTVTLSQGGLTALTAGASNAGVISVQADTVNLRQGAGIVTSTTGAGNAGQILINARNVTLDTSVVLSGSSGAGNAGNITINALDTISLMNGSNISTEAERSSGGNIRLTANNRVIARESYISTSVSGGATNGGNIDIDPEFVIVDHSRIIARAVGGNGGNINISTQYLVQSADSVIDASSQLGINGTVEIAGVEVDLDADLIPLSADFLNAKQWLAAACVNRQGNDVSQFTVNGRDGVYRSPADFAASPMMFDVLSGGAATNESHHLGAIANAGDSTWAAAHFASQAPIWLRPSCSQDPG